MKLLLHLPNENSRHIRYPREPRGVASNAGKDRALHVGRIVCLGDIVGYGASPNECVELLRERKIRLSGGESR
jgi:hypothetical protein